MSSQAVQVRNGIHVELASILWMLVEAAVAIGAGITAHSLSLTSFGVDSIIELIAGGMLLWRLFVEASGASDLHVDHAERRASWVVGVSLLALALYIIVLAAYHLSTHAGAQASLVGIGLSLASGIVMPILAKAKVQLGGRIGSHALKADGACSMVCAYMAWTVLAGALLTALFGWWWIDSLAALALVYFIIHEGLEAIQVARGMEDDCC